MVITAPVETAPAYEDLVARYAPQVRAWAGRELCPADADDATQAVFLVVWRTAEVPPDGPRLAGWLYGITRNVVRNARRSHGRRDRAEQAAGEHTKRLTRVDHDAEDDELLVILGTLIGDLPEVEREALDLYYGAGSTYAEIATTTGSRTSTVAARVQRGLQRLREGFARRGLSLTVLAIAAALSRASAHDIGMIKNTLLACAPSAPTSARATAELPAHIHRWSQGPTRMRTLSAGLCALLLSLTAIIASTTAAADDTNDGTPPPVGDEAAGGSIVVDNVLVIRLNDPQRSWQRLLTSPYAIALPATVTAEAAAVAPSLGPGWLALDVHSSYTPSARKKLHDMQQAMEGLSPEEQQAKAAEMIRDLQQDSSVTVAVSAGPGQNVAPMNLETGRFYDARGSLQLADPALGEPIVKLVQSFMRDAITPTTPAGTLSHWQDDGGSLTLRHTDGVLQLTSDSAHEDTDLQWLPDPVTAEFPEADIEYSYIARPHDTAAFHAFSGTDGDLPVLASGRLQITDTGIRLWAASHIQPSSEPWEPLTAAAYTPVPEDAIAALAWETDDIPPFLSLAMQVDWQALAASLSQAFAQANGPLLAYARPGAFWPTITLRLPIDEETGRTVCDAILATPSLHAKAQGEDLLMQINILACHLGCRDGELVFTTDPAGIDAVLAAPAGFFDLQEVQPALKPLATPSTVHAVVRNHAVAQALAPYIQLAPGTAGQHLQAFVDELPKAASWIRSGQDGTNTIIEADGALNALLLPMIGPALGPALGGLPMGSF